MGFFEKLKQGLAKTKNAILHRTDSLFRALSGEIDEDFYEELEETLIMGDIGVYTTNAILENLKAIDLAGSKIILRCPIIPGVNNTTDHFEGIANIANSLKNIVVIEIEPYHSLGNNKRKKLGQEEYCGFSNPAQQEIDEWITQIRNITNITVRKA